MKHVLLVDDDPWQIGVYQRILQREFSVASATNGYSAIEKIEDHHPDAIVLDILLAGSTAWTLLNELQSHDDLSAIPIILVTNSQIMENDLSHYGIVAILDKSEVHPRDILHEVRKAVV